MTFEKATMAEVRIELELEAAPNEVWAALTDGIGEWWPDSFYAGGSPGARRFVLEARPGGRMLEEWEDGGGLVWATVATVDPGRRLQVTGITFPEWGGPTLWLGSWSLSPEGEGTRLGFTESAIGQIEEGYRDEKTKGWRFLFDRALRAYLEGTEPPEWEG